MPLLAPRNRSPWMVVLASLLLLELFAFYLLCAHQMDRAQARHNLSQVELRAFRDCLAYVDGSTIASCGRQMRARR